MPVIGDQQLRAHTADVLRQFGQTGEECVVTRNGQPVARLLPVERTEAQRKAADGRNASEEYRRVMDDIRRHWPPGVSPQALMDQLRREL
mgnify:CR=1 FL=1